MLTTDYLYTYTGTKRIYSTYNVSKVLYDITRNNIIKILSIKLGARLNHEVGQKFTIALTNLFLYRFCVLGRDRFNTEEERLLILFSKVLYPKDFDNFDDDSIKVLVRDFAGHIFFDLTSDKKHRHYLAGQEWIPFPLLNMMSFTSFSMSKKKEKW